MYFTKWDWIHPWNATSMGVQMAELLQPISETNLNTFGSIILTEKKSQISKSTPLPWDPQRIFYICLPKMLKIGVTLSRVMQKIVWSSEILSLVPVWACESSVVENKWTDCRHNATVIHAAAEACCYFQQIGQKAFCVVQNLSQIC